MADKDSVQARISADCPEEAKEILTAAWQHDTAALKPLIRGPGKASIRDPTTGETPLHAAIRAAGVGSEAKDDEDSKAKAAEKTVQLLMENGAIWNDVDDHNETPGCVAWRLKQPSLYELCVSAGMRAEMLFAILDGYEALSSGEDEDEDEEENEEGAAENGADPANGDDKEAKENEVEMAEPQNESAEVTAAEDAPYLASHLTVTDGKLVDAAGNGVMMEWEADIMRRSVDALIGSADDESSKGKRILNIGFGLGIIDSMFAARKPEKHHIIEAHPEVLERIDGNGTPNSGDHAAEFGAAWEASGPTPDAFHIYRGRWQDLCATLLADGELYDAIYFDTFGEDYSQLHRFFSDYIPGLLDDGGIFGFFHGLGADRRICYDVYTRVVEMHLAEAGLDVEWRDADVALADDGLAEAGKGAWEGILRPYWTLDKYRLPICTFMG